MDCLPDPVDAAKRMPRPTCVVTMVAVRMFRLRVFAPLAALLIAGCGSGSQSNQHSASRGTSRAAGATSSSTPAGTTSGTTPQASAPGRCTPQQLRLTYLGSEGATGHIEASFQLRNVSQKTCTLFGYPGAQMLDAKGSALPTHVQRGGAFFANTRRRPREVRLVPGSSAGFVFGYSDNPEYGGGGPKPCPAATQLEVTPPNTYSQLVISLRGPSFAPCGGVLIASPVY